MRFEERRCVGCGCTDLRACPGGCSWVTLDPPVCSSCWEVDLDRGQALVEYAVVIAMVALVAIIVLGALGHTVPGMFHRIATAV